MSETDRIVCVACSHEIDAAAKLCPYCGADPRTGAKADTEAILQEMFPQRAEAKSEGVIEYARQRQGIVAVLGALVVVLLLAGLHEFVSRRNEKAVNAAVPLTDVTDLSNQPSETKPQPLPEMQFQYDGRPQTMRTLIVEPGAVAPQQPAPAQTTTQTTTSR